MSVYCHFLASQSVSRGDPHSKRTYRPSFTQGMRSSLGVRERVWFRIKAKLSLLWKKQSMSHVGRFCRHSGRSEPAMAQRHATGGTDPDRVGKGASSSAQQQVEPHQRVAQPLRGRKRLCRASIVGLGTLVISLLGNMRTCFGERCAAVQMTPSR
jgi:hypothetical protein